MAEATSDKIKTNCPSCGAEYVVFSALIGKEVRCVKCQISFTVPQSAQAAAPDPAPAAAEKPVTGGSPARYQKWLADQMLDISCPHCRFRYPISRAYIGQYMACPRCRDKFIISPHGHAMVSKTPFDRFKEDKGAVRAVAVAAGLLLLVFIIYLFASSARDSQLIGSLEATYSAPNYRIKAIDVPRRTDDLVEKVSDGSRECPSVARVQISHEPTGMEFNRMLCQADGVWGPTYLQHLMDEAALRYLEQMESGFSNFSDGPDVGDLATRMLSNSANDTYGKVSNRFSEVFNEEEKLKTAIVPAFSMLTKGNDWNDFNLYNDDDGDDFGFSGYTARYYLAHAVMYPDQAEELYREGLIRQRP